jgi:hypothetical protein
MLWAPFNLFGIDYSTHQIQYTQNGNLQIKGLKMSEFKNNPAVVTLGNTDWRLLLEPLAYDYGAADPWVVPAGKVSDGPSVPVWLRWLIPASAFLRAGYLHDDIRTKWTTGNASTDGFLRDAAIADGKDRAEKIRPWQAYLIYLGVRIGTHTGFKSEAPDAIIQEAKKEFATRNGVGIDKLYFDKTHSEIKIKHEGNWK